MYNNVYYPYQNFQPTQVGFRVFPVANIEEANACQVDYQGNPLFFYNKAKQEIYLKKFDPESGLVEFRKFEVAELPHNEIKKSDDIELLYDEINTIKDDLRRVMSYFNEKTKKGAKDDE